VNFSKSLAAALAAAALLIGAAGATPVASLLHIDVVALGRGGAPVLDLKPAEFEVWINGYQIPIETVTFVTPSQSEVSRTVVLLLDDMAMNQLGTPRIKEVARRFVDKLSPTDRMAIVTLNSAVMEHTADRERLLRAIDTYNVRGFPMRIDVAGQHVLRTVAGLSRQIAELSSGRKAIVALGAGWIFDTPIPPPTVAGDLRPEWVEAMQAMAAAHVSLYVIDPGGVGSRYVNSGESGFARETGGHAFINTNDLRGAVDRIWNELGTYYVLSVQDPPIGRKADLRELEVKVLRKGVTARARRGILPGA
jgi:VWFA-related protein